MASKLSILMVIAFLVIYFVLEGVFGTHGLLVNHDLERLLETRAKTRDATAVEIDAMQQRYQRSYDYDVVLDNAFNVGKTSPGDLVYYFAQDDVIDQNIDGHMSSGQRSSFQGIASPWLLLIALAAVLLTSYVVACIPKRRRKYSNEHHRIEKQ